MIENTIIAFVCIVFSLIFFKAGRKSYKDQFTKFDLDFLTSLADWFEDLEEKEGKEDPVPEYLRDLAKRISDG